jgi:lipoprotein Spr
MILRIIFLFLLSLPLTKLEAQVTFVETECPDEFFRYYQQSYYSQELGFEIPTDFSPLLYDTLVFWLGTPYRFAGNCEKGIDCSGFVTRIYNSVYNKSLGARNSAEIYNKMEKIDKDDLKEGDLVFFRIYKRRVSHIGLYLGNNKFIHSSTSKGVVVNDLNDNYYKKSFAGAGRIRGSIANIPAN